MVCGSPGNRELKLMVLDIFALIVIALLLSFTIWLVVFLGNMPGDIAQKNNHPQVRAITALSWVGLITMGIAWFVALVWAYYKPPTDNRDLQQQINELKQQLSQLKTGGDQS